MVTVRSRQLVGECPLLDIHQVQPVPTAGQALGVRQMGSLQATRRIQVICSGQDPHRATVPFSSRKGEGRLVQRSRWACGPVHASDPEVDTCRSSVPQVVHIDGRDPVPCENRHRKETPWNLTRRKRAGSPTRSGDTRLAGCPSASRPSSYVTARSSPMTSRPTRSPRLVPERIESTMEANDGADLIRAGDKSARPTTSGRLNQRMSDGALEGGAHPEVRI